MLVNNYTVKILHITPHLGGGVGSVLLNYLAFVQNDHNYSHSIVTLDYANEKSKKASEQTGFKLYSDMYKDIDGLLELMKNSDIVLIHFWNHPLLYDFLVRNKLPASRVVFWSHISGFIPPNIFPQKLLNYPDKFVFTTPLSFNTNEVKEFEYKDKLAVIWSTGGVEHVKNIEKKEHEKFNIGYIGTVDYSKMHPDFLEICATIDIPNVKFIICGGAKYLEIQKQAQIMGIADKFEFVGEVKDITKYLSKFDVFGYPLNPDHYGTCDQVLQEAMAAGIVPAVLNNPMENYMLNNGEIGIVAQNKGDYISSIEKLYKNSELRQSLSKKAKEYAISKYSLEKLSDDWNIIFADIVKSPKTFKKWEIKKTNISYFDIFLESLGNFRSNFIIKSDEDVLKIKKLGKIPNWQSKTKGTPHQYFDFFPNDVKLKNICELMK